MLLVLYKPIYFATCISFSCLIYIYYAALLACDRIGRIVELCQKYDQIDVIWLDYYAL